MEVNRLKEITKYYENNSTIEINEVIKNFYYFFYSSKEFLQQGILLLDNNEIIKIQNQLNGRSFWIIKGGNYYLNLKVLKSYCPCQDYYNNILKVGKNEACCKHLIAIYLGTSLHKIETRYLNNEDFVKMMLENS